MPVKYTKEKELEVINAYKVCEICHETAEMTRTSVCYVSKILKKYNIENKTTSRDREILADYLKEPNPKKLAKIYSVDYTTIYNVLKRNKVKPIKPKRIHKYQCDKEFFSKINTERKAYWVGFIAADGFCSYREKYKCLSVCLSIVDEAHLNLFKTHIDGNFPTRRIQKPTGDTVEVRFYNPTQPIKDLAEKHGMDNNKTYSLNWDKVTENIPEEFMRFFILGFIDGDGTFYTENAKGRGRIRFEVGAKPRDFMEKFKNYLCNKAGLKHGELIYHKKKDFWRLNRSKREEIQSIYNYLYNNTTIFLKRKRDKVKNFYKNNLNLDIDLLTETTTNEFPC